MTAGRWRSVPVAAGLRVRTRGADVPMPAEIAATVAAIWDAECRRRPDLFNGRVFCADAVGHDEIVGHWTEYRRVLAQIRRPALFAALGIRSLAVNGLIECADGLVLGRRSADAVYLPGHWQAAPAGSVEAGGPGDGVDLRGQVLAELREELGLEASEVASMRPVLAIEHADTRIVDVGFLLATGRTFPEIERLHRMAGNGEYDGLRLIAREALREFLARDDPMLTPSARFLLETWAGACRP